MEKQYPIALTVCLSQIQRAPISLALKLGPQGAGLRSGGFSVQVSVVGLQRSVTVQGTEPLTGHAGRCNELATLPWMYPPSPVCLLGWAPAHHLARNPTAVKKNKKNHNLIML